MHPSQYGLKRVRAASPDVLKLVTSHAPWSYLILAIVILVITASIVVIAIHSLREGRSVDVGIGSFRIAIGARPQAPMPAQDVPAPNEVPSALPSSAPEPRLAWQNHVDGINHERLLAVDDKIRFITGILMNRGAGWVMTVSGEGGMGKTAVTFETVKSIASTGEFTRIVWASAKSSGYGEVAIRQRIETVYWEDIVAVIAEQLGCRLRRSQDLWEEDLRRYVAKLGKEERWRWRSRLGSGSRSGCSSEVACVRPSFASRLMMRCRDRCVRLHLRELWTAQPKFEITAAGTAQCGYGTGHRDEY